jgi:hypothetical protein
MSRVEPKHPRRNEDRREHSSNDERRQPLDRTPSKAEGDEATVDEALRRQERQ